VKTRVLLTSLERTPGRDGVPSHAARGSLTWTPKHCPHARVSGVELAQQPYHGST